MKFCSIKAIHLTCLPVDVNSELSVKSFLKPLLSFSCLIYSLVVGGLYTALLHRSLKDLLSSYLVLISDIFFTVLYIHIYLAL